MRDYRRAGLDLPKAQRDEVERMRKELSRLTTDFESNVTKAEKAVKFTKAELEGVPEDFLEQIKTGDDEYTVMANVTVAIPHRDGERQTRGHPQTVAHRTR